MTRPFPASLFMALAFLCLLSTPSQSQTVSYDEAVSGDVDDHGPFELNVGRNTIVGTVSLDYTLNQSVIVDWDSPVIVVPEGTHLVSIRYDISSTSGDSGVIGYNLSDQWPPATIPIAGFRPQFGLGRDPDSKRQPGTVAR